MMESNRLVFPTLVFVTVCTLLLPACISSLCGRDADCPSGQICIETTGQCVTPECTSSEQCGSGYVCDDHFCVVGCTTADECGEGQMCVSSRCVDVSDCDCPLAPTFCQQDLNPGSPTGGQQVCVPQAYADGVALFFGSVGCSICRDIFASVVALESELEAGGPELTLMFVQSQSVEAQSADIERLLGSTDACVVQDTATLDIWGTYNAHSYDLIILNTVGCYADRFESLSVSEVEGELGDQIGEAWRAAATVECPEDQ